MIQMVHLTYILWMSEEVSIINIFSMFILQLMKFYVVQNCMDDVYIDAHNFLRILTDRASSAVHWQLLFVVLLC